MKKFEDSQTVTATNRQIFFLDLALDTTGFG